MGRVHASTPSPVIAAPRRFTLGRLADVVAGSLLLALALPLIAVLALLVRHGSNGPVLHRRHCHHRGEPVVLVSFRTTIDGAGTVSHERLRAIVGDSQLPVTGIGRFMRLTRTDRLPRLFDVVRGNASLLG
ncbi:MAG: sugar transferase [Solirubrobacteraceae bacterium]